MKKIFACKDEKITQKAFSQSLVISGVSILLCLVVLCSATYAWFTSETSSTSNKLSAGSFDVTITVSKVGDGGENVDAIEVESNNEGKYTYTFSPGTYSISLKLTDTSTVKGHCVVNIGNGEAQHTAASIGENTANIGNEDITNPFTFTITVAEITKVVLEPRWGVAAEPDIENGGIS